MGFIQRPRSATSSYQPAMDPKNDTTNHLLHISLLGSMSRSTHGNSKRRVSSTHSKHHNQKCFDFVNTAGRIQDLKKNRWLIHWPQLLIYIANPRRPSKIKSQKNPFRVSCFRNSSQQEVRHPFNSHTKPAQIPHNK